MEDLRDYGDDPDYIPDQDFAVPVRDDWEWDDYDNSDREDYSQQPMFGGCHGDYDERM
jgi:hypothetical protein